MMKRLMTLLTILAVLCAPVLSVAGEETNPVVRISVAGLGDIYAELCPETAPITVENFLSLVDSGFYDGLTFHRIISGFMVQGGDPKGNGTGGSGRNIKGEFSSNGVENPLAHERGVLSMARSSAPDSASSQLFIMHDAAPHLDGGYAAFGRVLAGMAVVDAMCARTHVTDNNGTVDPADQPRMTAVARATREEAEAAAAAEKEIGRAGSVYADPCSDLRFPVPEGWNLSERGAYAAVFTGPAEGDRFRVQTVAFWDRLGAGAQAAYEVQGRDRSWFDTSVFDRSQFAGALGIAAEDLAEEELDGVTWYTYAASSGQLARIGARNGVVVILMALGPDAGEIMAAVAQSLTVE